MKQLFINELEALRLYRRPSRSRGSRAMRPDLRSRLV
ncbi:hypothetical protein [Enterobacter phage 04_vB_Eclo_IJM]|nr:hypothetical protein [Enterobacter phage 02_vB_Eclo_IJM]UZT50476.1 hypothetical protein [Enterobacter phage 04_vB_Eclo_IJM]